MALHHQANTKKQNTILLVVAVQHNAGRVRDNKDEPNIVVLDVVLVVAKS
jgi:hypothetical protein